jgi:hypothetical protein
MISIQSGLRVNSLKFLTALKRLRTRRNVGNILIAIHPKYFELSGVVGLSGQSCKEWLVFGAVILITYPMARNACCSDELLERSYKGICKKTAVSTDTIKAFDRTAEVIPLGLIARWEKP